MQESGNIYSDDNSRNRKHRSKKRKKNTVVLPKWFVIVYSIVTLVPTGVSVTKDIFDKDSTAKTIVIVPERANIVDIDDRNGLKIHFDGSDTLSKNAMNYFAGPNKMEQGSTPDFDQEKKAEENSNK